MKIAVCDDDGRDLLQIAFLLESYRNDRKAELTYVSFQNATELLDSIDSRDYDLPLLDVLMSSVNGIQAAREIREQNRHVEIVFLTSSPEYAVESYSVRAHYYLLKPASEEKLIPILDRLLDDFKKPEDALRIKTHSSVTYTDKAGERTKKQAMLAGGAGEAMLASYSYFDIESLLSDCGFLIYEHLNPKEITEQYILNITKQIHNILCRHLIM